MALMGAAPIMGQTAKDCFKSMPDSLMPLLTQVNRADFIDFLEASGQHLWQILPLNPITSYGNSPYQGFSVANESIATERLCASGVHRSYRARTCSGQQRSVLQY